MWKWYKSTLRNNGARRDHDPTVRVPIVWVFYIRDCRNKNLSSFVGSDQKTNRYALMGIDVFDLIKIDPSYPLDEHEWIFREGRTCLHLFHLKASDVV
jgi:hypothetical protein